MAVVRKTTLNNSTVHFLRLGKDPSCACRMEGYCSCDFIMQFMQCMKNVCNSDKCDCNDNTFLDSCKVLDGQCTKLPLQCSPDKVTCGQTVFPHKGEQYRLDGDAVPEKPKSDNAKPESQNREDAPKEQKKDSKGWMLVFMLMVGFIVLGIWLFHNMF